MGRWGDREVGGEEKVSKMIRSFKELDVWKNAMDAAMEIFALTKKFPLELFAFNFFLSLHL